MQKSKLLFTIVALFATIFSACGDKSEDSKNNNNNESFMKTLSVQESKNLIDENSENQNFVVLDVRTPDEFLSGHIKKSVLIDYNSKNFKEEISKLDKSKTYLVYCRSGNRSKSANEIMNREGFKDIYNMNGGINSWIAAGYETEI